MAKNLKLNIKNTQLAKALEIKKVKLSAAGKKKEKSLTKKSESGTEEEQPKLKARILPPKLSEPKVNTEPTLEEVKQPKEKKTLPKEKKIPSTSEEEKEKPLDEKKLVGEIIEPKPKKSPIEKKSTEEKKPPEEKEPKIPEVATPIVPPEIQEEIISLEKKAEPTKKQLKKVQKEEFEEEEEGGEGGKEKRFKAKDFKAKKTEELRTFDSRLRHGLTTEVETERWRKKRPSIKPSSKQIIPIIRPEKLNIILPISIKDLAAQMKLKASEIIKKLFTQGLTLTLNDLLDDETTVQLLGQEFNCEITIDHAQEERIQITRETIKEEIKSTPVERLKFRPPIVTFMGHVDHGKTSIIDAIRKSKIAATEAGAITQHIGAFTAKTSLGEITILDTPGHEAFSEMRARGATVTDIVILVIAGDEGIREQTVEAIEQAKQSKASIIVAINKSDKQGFDPEKVYRQLADYDLLPEAWGGTIITVNCSALSGKGIPELLEMISLQAEVLELKADPSARARGTILESQMHKGLGAVATVLVQNGTLKINDAFVFGDNYGRVKTMHDQYGKNLLSAGPSTPVKITGLSNLADAGCSIIVVSDEKEAKSIAKERAEGLIRDKLQKSKKVSLETLLEQKKEIKILAIILRADVQGSLEALEKALLKIHSEKVKLNIISSEVGEISESDIEFAAASNAMIVGFHTRIESHCDSLIKQMKVPVILHDIIYHAIDEVKQKMRDMLDKIEQETDTGKAKVIAVFKSSNLGKIAGCLVTDGTIKRSQHVRIKREGQQIWRGKISSLKRVKEDVKEVQKGIECGILFEGFSSPEENDIIEAFDISYLTQDL